MTVKVSWNYKGKAKMKGVFNDLLKHAEDMKTKVERLREELLEIAVTGEAGGGMVKITVNGRYEVESVNVEDGVLIGEKGLLEDLLAGAMNDANRKISNLNKEKMESLTGGIEMPFNFNQLFDK